MIRSLQIAPALLLGLLLTLFTPTSAAAPFDAMLSFSPDIVTAETTSQFHRIRYVGNGRPWGWDFRHEDGDKWRQFDAHLYEVEFRDGPSLVFQVNREFGASVTAQLQIYRYAAEVGRIPPALRAGFKTVSIHRGNIGFGSGATDFPIHTHYAERLAAIGYLEEYLLYNAVRASLTPSTRNAAAWRAAQQADGGYVTDIAASDPEWDVPESFLAYLAAMHRAERIGTERVAAILDAIPNRIAYFRSLRLNLRPLAYENVIDERTKGFFTRDDMPGQGLAIDVDVPNNVVEAVWYTASPDTGQLVWYSLFGDIRGDRTGDLLIFRNAGARFVESAPIRPTRVGVATLHLIDCDTVELEYNLHAHQRTGTLRLDRTLSSPEACALVD